MPKPVIRKQATRRRPRSNRHKQQRPKRFGSQQQLGKNPGKGHRAQPTRGRRGEKRRRAHPDQRRNRASIRDNHRNQPRVQSIHRAYRNSQSRIQLLYCAVQSETDQAADLHRKWQLRMFRHCTEQLTSVATKGSTFRFRVGKKEDSSEKERARVTDGSRCGPCIEFELQIAGQTDLSLWIVQCCAVLQGCQTHGRHLSLSLACSLSVLYSMRRGAGALFRLCSRQLGFNNAWTEKRGSR